MAVALNLFIDVSRNALVTGPANPNGTNLPPMVQGDQLVFNIYLLQPTGTLSPPYTVLSNAGQTMQVAIGDKIGNATNYYATQFVWVADPANQYFSATFSLNTAQITTLLGANPTVISTFEVKIISGAGVPTTVLEIPVTINAAVIKGGAVGALQPGLTPVSLEYVIATCLTRLIQGQVIFKSPDGTKKAALYVDNDGACHFDPTQ